MGTYAFMAFMVVIYANRCTKVLAFMATDALRCCHLWQPMHEGVVICGNLCMPFLTVG